jgi:hypothetical protein
VLSEVSDPEPCIILPEDVSIEDLKLLVDFIYRGEIRFMMSQLASLSKLAEMLGIPGLPGFTGVFTQEEDEELEKANEKIEWAVGDSVQEFDDSSESIEPQENSNNSVPVSS